MLHDESTVIGLVRRFPIALEVVKFLNILESVGELGLPSVLLIQLNREYNLPDS